MDNTGKRISFDGAVVFTMSGGVFNDVFSDIPTLKVIVIDWDDIDLGDPVGPPLAPDPMTLLPDETRALVEESLTTTDETT